jgi:hypothetical protein
LSLRLKSDLPSPNPLAKQTTKRTSKRAPTQVPNPIFFPYFLLFSTNPRNGLLIVADDKSAAIYLPLTPEKGKKKKRKERRRKKKKEKKKKTNAAFSLVTFLSMWLEVDAQVLDASMVRLTKLGSCALCACFLLLLLDNPVVCGVSWWPGLR